MRGNSVLQFNSQLMSKKQVYCLAARMALYTLAIFALMFSLPHIFARGGFALFVENGVVEWFQFVLLTSITMMLLVAIIWSRTFRQILLVLFCLTAFATVRELDAILDRIVPYVGWKLAAAVPAALFVYVVAGWRRYKPQFRWFLFTPSIFLFWSGFVVAVPVAQMLGNGDLLQEIMGNSYEARFKRVIEETGESIGYVILLFAAIECLVNIRMTLASAPPLEA